MHHKLDHLQSGNFPILSELRSNCFFFQNFESHLWQLAISEFAYMVIIFTSFAKIKSKWILIVCRPTSIMFVIITSVNNMIITQCE